MNKLSYIAFIFKNYRSKIISVLYEFICAQQLYVPNRRRIIEEMRGTIKGPQWCGLGTRAPKSYHSVLFLTNHNFSAPNFTKLMLWPNQESGIRNQESGISNILLSPMASNIKYIQCTEFM